jgi:dTDP-4-dehydrorhamnose reductase
MIDLKQKNLAIVPNRHLKLLIIGGSGLVGSTLTKYAADIFDIHLTYNTTTPESNCPSTKIQLPEEFSKLENLIKKFKPNIIVHTVSHPSVDWCQENPNLANEFHIDMTKNIANIAKKINSRLIYLSTEWVFGGQLNKKYTELDSPNPINHYGYTKLEAEKIVLNSNSKNVVLWPAVIYGWHKKSRFTNWILTSLKEGKIVDPHIDQYNTPTLVDDLANGIIKIIENNLFGLFHITGKTCLNRFEFALKIAEIFNLDENLIKPVTKNEKPQNAPRPNSTCLDSRKLEKLIDCNFRDISSGIEFMLNQSKKSKYD